VSKWKMLGGYIERISSFSAFHHACLLHMMKKNDRIENKCKFILFD